jgi:hypothetical protein
MVDTVGIREPQSPGSHAGARPATRGSTQGGWHRGHSVLRATTQTLAKVVWAVVGIVDAVLLLDFAFRLIAARDDGFAHAVFSFGSTVAGPFDGIFASVGRIAGYAFRWSDLVAVFLCTLAGFLVTGMLGRAGSRQR